MEEEWKRSGSGVEEGWKRSGRGVEVERKKRKEWKRNRRVEE